VSELKQKIEQFVYYTFFAGIATIVDVGLLYGFTEFAGISYLISAALSYLFGMATNYSLNKKFTFKNKSRRITLQFSVFMGVALVGLILNLIIMFVLVEFFGLWYMLAKVVSLFIVLMWSYLGHKKITFGKIK